MKRPTVEELDAAAAARLAGVTIAPIPPGLCGGRALALDAIPGRCIICDELLPAGRRKLCGSLECKDVYDETAQRVNKQQRRAGVAPPHSSDRWIHLEQLAEFA